MRFLQRFFLLIAMLGLTACGSIKLAYNYAPSLLQYQLDSYLDLTDDQEALLTEELVAFQAWHRERALPEYAATLRDWASKLDEPHTFTVPEILGKQKMFEEDLLVIGQRSALHLAPLVLTLTPEQRKQLSDEFEASNEEYAEENLGDSSQSLEERKERFVERYERWLGTLTDNQSQTIDDWLATQPDTATLWGRERIARQQALLDILAQAQDSPSAEQAAVALHDYFQSLSRYRVTALQAQREPRLMALAELTVSLLNQMTDRQRRFLQETLRDYANDFEDLSS